MNSDRDECILLHSSLGRDFLKEHADGTELLIARSGLDELGDLLDLARTAHLTWGRDGRINMGSPDRDFREADLAYLKELVQLAGPLEPMLYVIHPLGVRQLDGVHCGEWEILVPMLQRLADETREERTGPLVIENNRAYWQGVSDDTPVEAADRSGVTRCFGETPEEWGALMEAVDRDDVHLCLDPSHATTSAQLLPEGPPREECLRAYLRYSDRIRHVHWSDNYLQDNRGRDDSHLPVGQGTLPLWFHKALRELDATYMFEVKDEPQVILDMLEYVRSL